MKLYLVQHGKALPKEKHPDRPLAEDGKQDVERVAAWFARLAPEISEIRHSGKTRAKETAEIIARHLKQDIHIIHADGMSPNDDVQPIAEALQTQQDSVMLVGHLPFLCRLASYLLSGEPEQTIVQFHMGGIVCLIYQNETWSVSWMITPELV